jgi:hypothetical protein
MPEPPGQAAACLLEKRWAFFVVDPAPHSLPTVLTGAPLVRAILAGLSTINATPSVGEHSSVGCLVRRSECNGEKHVLLARDVVVHTGGNCFDRQRDSGGRAERLADFVVRFLPATALLSAAR